MEVKKISLIGKFKLSKPKSILLYFLQTVFDTIKVTEW